MQSIGKLELALTSDLATMSADHKEALKTVKDWIDKDEVLQKAIKLYEAIMKLDKFEHDQKGNCVIRFTDQLEDLNDAEYDNKPGTLPDIFIRAGERIKEEFEVLK